MMRRIAPLAAVVAVLGLSASAQASYPTASNGQIYFSATPGGLGSSNNIYALSGPGGTLRPVTTDPATDEYAPAVSPDGKRLLVEVRSPGGVDYDIYVVNTNGTGLTNLTTGTPTTYEFEPAFSPDGKRIVFTSSMGAGTEHLFLMNADGSNKVPLLPSVRASYADFSPDGKSIAYLDEDCPCVGVVGSDGSSPRRILNTPPVAGGVAPSFSPDGRRIAYSATGDTGSGDIFVVNADGSGAVNLTRGGADDSGPAFSPEGTAIAFSRSAGPGTHHLFTVPPGGGAIADLMPSATGFNTEPAWEYVFKCAGRRATIIGTNAADTLRGTKRADVIVGNGARDKIRGRGGNDRVCGGAGPDKILGMGVRL